MEQRPPAPLDRSAVRDGMRIDWNAPIEVDDGLLLRADVYRPTQEGRYPVILSYGPYGKGLSFQEAYAAQWEKMVQEHPEVLAGSSGKYMNWEVADPERWVPHGYACVRVDSRGAGCSPGFMDNRSPRESRDLYQCIEWAARQPWSSGRVGLLGISYYAINQWLVAGLKPPHLAAMIPWEGAGDLYRDATHHGGILCEFPVKWYATQVKTVQHGVGSRGRKSPNTGEWVAGPVTLSEEELERNRADYPGQIRSRPVDGPWYRERSARWSEIEVPFLSAANWGGHGLHARGNFEAFTEAASDQKWLEVHGDTHWTHFYTDYGVSLQRRFFDHFLKGMENGWDREPRVLLNMRYPGERFELRKEQEWPLERTRWTKLYLNPAELSLSAERLGSESTVEYEALGEGVTFSTPPLEEETEITGPMAARLYVSSRASDADLFLIVRLFDPRGEEVVFQGALDPHTPIAFGWLRASHRRLDPQRSEPYRPYHPHDRVEPLAPGEVYELEVEIWPSCIVAPPGCRIALTVRGRDYEYGGEVGEFARRFHYASRGVGPFTHDDRQDRPPEVSGGRVTLHAGGGRDAYLLLPVIP